MNVLVDARETPERIELAKSLFDVQIVQLEIGDYLHGDVIIEYKGDDIINFSHLDRQANDMLNHYGSDNSYLIVGRNYGECAIRFSQFRNRSVDAFHGFISSLMVRGLKVLFCGNRETAFTVMRKIFLKSGDGKDRAKPKLPIIKSDNREVKALMGFGFSEEQGRELLEYYGIMDIIKMSKELGELSYYRLKKNYPELSKYYQKFKDIKEIIEG